MTALVIGTTIGSGIFRVPAAVATEVGSPGAIALVWVLGGVISLCGALTLAELAAAFPASGGVFVYLREAYGPLVAFLFGWTQLFLAPAGTTALALVFAEYLGTMLPLTSAGIRLAAAAVILVVGAAAYCSVRGLGGLVGLTSAAKFGALVALVVAVFLLSDGEAGSLNPGAATFEGTAWSGVGMALVAALWSYNGFHDMVCVAGEVREPGRVLPRALLAGMISVLLIYLAANAAYLYVLPLETLQRSPLVASDAALKVLGPAGASAIAALVMVSTFGAFSGLGLINPRLFYAMARDGLLFEPFGRVHPRFQTPHVAVAGFTAACLVFVSSRSFEQLTAAFVLGTWPSWHWRLSGSSCCAAGGPPWPDPTGHPAIRSYVSSSSPGRSGSSASPSSPARGRRSPVPL